MLSLFTPGAARLPDAAGPSSAAAQEAPQEAAREWGTEEIMHHIVDARYLELLWFEIDLDALSLPPIHVAGLEIDLSVTRYVIFLFVAGILTVVTMWLAARQTRRLHQGEEAPGGLLNAIEAFYLYLRDDVAMANIGRGGEPFVPYVITLFFFILYANLLGLVPSGATATANIMVTGALAFITFVVVEFSGFRELGPGGYLRTIFYAPPGVHPVMAAIMLVIMTPVEIVGKLAKPFALAIRLFANMTAGHVILLSLLGLILTYGAFGQPAGVVAIFGSLALGLFVSFLEIFVAFLQAYIFAILTAVFIGLIRHAEAHH